MKRNEIKIFILSRTFSCRENFEDCFKRDSKKNEGKKWTYSIGELKGEWDVLSTPCASIAQSANFSVPSKWVFEIHSTYATDSYSVWNSTETMYLFTINLIRKERRV